jgi:hypothetical protein
VAEKKFAVTAVGKGDCNYQGKETLMKRPIARTVPTIITTAMLGFGLFGAKTAFCADDGAKPAPPPATRPANDRPRPTPQALGGEVTGYNLEPRGNYSGIILKDGARTMQLNVPPGASAMFVAAAPVGQRVAAMGIAESNQGDRMIYRLVSLTGADGKEIALPTPDSVKQMHAEGTVKQLNYTPRGEVDGAILDTGDFVHVDPQSAATLNLAIGQKITADGSGQPMLIGHNVIEADNVNGTKIDRPERGPRSDMGFGGGGRGPGMRDGGPGMRGGGPGMRDGGPRQGRGMDGDGPPGGRPPRGDGDGPPPPPGQ